MRTKIITNPTLDSLTMTFYGSVIDLSDSRLKVYDNGKLFSVANVELGIIMYARYQEELDNYTINVYLATNDGLKKWVVTTAFELPEDKVIETETKEKSQYIPDLMMTSSHDFRTYWKDTFNIDVQVFDGRINSNPQASSFEGRINDVDVKVLLSLDDVPFATLSGVTANNGHWGGEYFFQDNSFPGEYVVDVIASYLGETVSKTSSMFIIGTVGGSGGCGVLATGTATLDTVIGATHSTGTATLTSVVNPDTVTVNSLSYLAVAGAATDNTEFSIAGDNNADATALAAAINSRDGTVVRAEVSTNVVTVYAITLVAATGDAITLAQTGGHVAVSGATLAGGVNVSDEVTLNALQYSPVTNPLVTPIEGEFNSGVSNSADASALSNAINLDTRGGTSGDLSSTVTTNIVTITTNICGPNGNLITMSKTGTTITISGATLLQ